MRNKENDTRNLETQRHDDVIKWKHFPRYWPFVRGIHRSPVNSLHKGQWRGALKFSVICVWINGWVNNREAGDLRRYCAHYEVIVMVTPGLWKVQWFSNLANVYVGIPSEFTTITSLTVLTLIYYSDVIMGAMASQITSVSIACSTVCSGADQRKHQNFLVTGLCGGNPPVTGKCFHLMTSPCTITILVITRYST